MLAPVYGSAENVGIEPIIVAELKLRDVERHIFGRHWLWQASWQSLRAIGAI